MLNKYMRLLFGVVVFFLWGVKSVYATTDTSLFTYEVKEDGTAIITSCTATGDIVIPEKIDGYVVTELKERLFYNQDNITSVYIPKTVKGTGTRSYVFSYCNDLTAIYVDEENEFLCSDAGVLFNKDKTHLYNYPIAKLGASYTVPASVTFINCTAFACAKNLTNVKIKNRSCEWETFTFYNINNLQVYYRPGGYSEKCVNLHVDRGGSYESNTMYPKYVAWSCTEEQHADMNNWVIVEERPATCVTEGRTSYWYCSECYMMLKEAETIKLKPHTYGEWQVLEEATCNEYGKRVRICEACGSKEYDDLSPTYNHSFGEWQIIKESTCCEYGEKVRRCNVCGDEDYEHLNVTNIHTDVVIDVIEEPTCDESGWARVICTLCKRVDEKVIPATGYVVGGHFYQYDTIYKVKSVLGNTGTVVFVAEKSDFYTSYTLPQKVKSGGITFTVVEIGKDAFRNNKKLNTVTIPSSIKKIGSGAFGGCTKLKKVTIGSGVTTICEKAFYGCKKLKNMTINSKKLKKVGKNAIKDIHKKAVIKVPKKQLSKYKKLFTKKTGYKKTMKIKK